MSTINRKPKDIPGSANIDIYWEQFAEPGDKPKIHINVYGMQFDNSSAEEMLKIAKYLTQASKWLQDEINAGRI